MNDIATVISACSLDARFLPFVIRESRRISSEVVVSAFHRRLDGAAEPDDWPGWLQSVCAPLGARVVWTANRESEPAKWHHNQARWAGLEATKAPWVLFLDADEIPEADPFSAWFREAERAKFHSASFGCFWYFRSARLRAQICERCGLLVRRELCKKALMFTENERYSFERQPRHLPFEPRSLNAAPFFHHYSWVHPKAQMLAKVQAWAHKGDKPWTGLVLGEFLRDFNAATDQDFVHAYKFHELPAPVHDVGDFAKKDES